MRVKERERVGGWRSDRDGKAGILRHSERYNGEGGE